MSLLEFTLEDWLVLQEEEKELACEEARAEGLMEGHSKGHAEGLTIGHAEGYVEGKQFGEKRDIQIERENSVKIFVAYLKKHLPDFEAVFQEVTSYENYTNYTREQPKEYYDRDNKIE